MKILYLMNIEWHWIKQRPHYIAEGLSENDTVFVYYPYSWHRQGKGYVENATDRFTPRRYFNIPFIYRSAFLNKLNTLYLRAFFALVILFKRPDVIWIAKPQDIDYIPRNVRARIVYDCMDDHYSMQGDENILRCEKLLTQRCGAVFASSISLMDKLRSRYGLCENVHLIRNGYNPSLGALPEYRPSKETFDLCYVGTVSSWFDFGLMEKILDRFENVRINIIGPVEAVISDEAEKLAKDSRVKFFGSVEHSKLPEYIGDSDCFLLPFQINDIIRSVDPVKLYEYISFGRNILSVHYEEIDRFEPFVYFYDNCGEALAQLEKMMKEPALRYSKEKADEFLKDNTWKSRVEAVESILASL
ncbi:MAG: hypothetical protein IKD81_08750 [Eubacteriaceae bacterium]|nr:hypothetical protein [Eubacteriaceae bacterium]